MGNGRRLEMVQDSLELLVDQLRPSDTVGIVAYTDTAWVVLEHTSARNSRQIIDAIYSLFPMASTNAEAGLILGYHEAGKAYIPGGINRVILCSDGVANVGETGPEGIMDSIRDYASEGITLTSVGVGMGNYNDVLMEQLADQGLFAPVIEWVMTYEGKTQEALFYMANGVLSMISDNVFVATVYIGEVDDMFQAGQLTREQFDALAIAINTGTNIPSVATPNGQAAFLFLLTSTLAPLIRLSYGRMVVMAIPYTITMSITGLIALWYLHDYVPAH